MLFTYVVGKAVFLQASGVGVGVWENFFGRRLGDMRAERKNLKPECDFRTKLFLPVLVVTPFFHVSWTKAFHHYTYVNLLTFPRMFFLSPNNCLLHDSY